MVELLNSLLLILIGLVLVWFGLGLVLAFDLVCFWFGLVWFGGLGGWATSWVAACLVGWFCSFYLLVYFGLFGLFVVLVVWWGGLPGYSFSLFGLVNSSPTSSQHAKREQISPVGVVA